MPLYEFYCDTCGKFEQMINLNSYQETAHCPMCNSSKTRRIFSPPSHSGVFSGVRHKARRIAERGREPRLVSKEVGKPLEGTLPMPHTHHHDHKCGASSPGYPPWMIKHWRVKQHLNTADHFSLVIVSFTQPGCEKFNPIDVLKWSAKSKEM